MSSRDDTVQALLSAHGRTFADEIGVDLSDDDPASVFSLLVAAILFASRIDHRIAAEAASALFEEGWTTPEALGDAGWQARTDTLNAAGYARYDESTSRMLGDTCALALERYDGDLRRIRKEADGDPAVVRRRVTDFKGIGEVGAEIFLREIQAVWTELAPYVDDRAADAARALDLPHDAEALADLAGDDFPRLVAALVRTSVVGDGDRIRRIAAGDEPAPVDVDSRSRDELYAEAQHLNVSGRSDMKKDELAEAVQRARSDDG